MAAKSPGDGTERASDSLHVSAVGSYMTPGTPRDSLRGADLVASHAPACFHARLGLVWVAGGLPRPYSSISSSWSICLKSSINASSAGWPVRVAMFTQSLVP